jgi:hypothetical protein
VSEGGVWLVRDARVHRQRVRTGILGTLRTEIVEGVAEGDSVVSLPPAELSDGARVRVVAASP